MSHPLEPIIDLVRSLCSWQAVWLAQASRVEPAAWLEDPLALALALPPLALPLFVFASALIEYVFPPYWGDMFVLLGFFLAGQGVVSPAIVFAAALSGSIVGSIIAYRLGERYGLAVIRRFSSSKRRGHSRQRVRDLFRRFGKKLLLVNRFLPVVRGGLLYGAGALRLRFAPVIFYCALSNLAFMGLLMWAGLWTAGSWAEIQAAFQRSNRLIGGALLTVVAVWVATVLWRKRARQELVASSSDLVHLAGAEPERNPESV